MTWDWKFEKLNPHALTFLAEIVVGRKSDKSFEFLFSLSGPYTWINCCESKKNQKLALYDLDLKGSCE